MSTKLNLPFRFHQGLGYKVRGGSLKDQGDSTYDLCISAINGRRWRDAAALAEYTIFEATEPHELFRDWIIMVRAFVVERGISEETIAHEEASLLTGLKLPDGSPYDAEAGWSQVNSLVGQTTDACLNQNTKTALEALEKSRLAWLETHDRKCDWLQGLVDIAAAHLGQESVGQIWRELMQPMFESYDKYDVDNAPWPESADKLLFVTAEALRGHLSGPGRRGSIEYVREKTRQGFRFTPCGSGGRNFDDSAFQRFSRTKEEFDWAWNTKGVCLYCAHCCALSELNPIEQFGYPARVVEPPFVNEDGERNYCTWWIYDDYADVPESVYEQTGNTKPTDFGGAATRARREAEGVSKRKG